MHAGATPKLTTSARESNCFPNSEETFNSLATNPSKKSKIPDKTTKKATFNFSLTDGETNDRIAFNGGTEMLHPNEPSYFLPTFSFTNVKIVELTDDSLCFIAIRADNDYLIYHLVPKS